MVYKTFLQNIQTSVQRKLGEQFQVELRQILKNNGNLLDGLSISSDASPLSPTIYLNAYYEEAENGLPLSVITDQIALLYEEQAEYSPYSGVSLECFENIRERIVYKIVNTKDNPVLLTQIPQFPFLDLSIIFYLILSECKEGQMTALIHHEHLKVWNITEDTLLTLAEENTPKLMPAKISPIEDVLIESGICKELSYSSPEQASVCLHVMTNQIGMNGAVCILYPNVLKNFAAILEDDLIILPSSIHEVLLAPAEKVFSYKELNELIALINRSEVPDEERLSDHIYYYSRKENRIIIPFSSEKGGKKNPQ